MTSKTPARPTHIGRAWHSRSIDDRWDMYRYVVAALWAGAFIMYTPSALQPVLTPVTTWIPMLVIIVGAIIAAIGRYLNEHLRVELWGVIAIVLGLGFYLVLNLVLIVFASPERLAQTLFTLLAMSFAAQRVRFLLPRLVEAARSSR